MFGPHYSYWWRSHMFNPPFQCHSLGCALCLSQCCCSLLVVMAHTRDHKIEQSGQLAPRSQDPAKKHLTQTTTTTHFCVTSWLGCWLGHRYAVGYTYIYRPVCLLLCSCIVHVSTQLRVGTTHTRARGVKRIVGRFAWRRECENFSI